MNNELHAIVQQAVANGQLGPLLDLIEDVLMEHADIVRPHDAISAVTYQIAATRVADVKRYALNIGL